MQMQPEEPACAPSPIHCSCCSISADSEGRRIEIEILSNWGNLNYIGITGLDADFEEFDLPVPTVLGCAEMTPPGAIVSSQRLTTDSRHMWTGVQPLKPEVVVLHFDLEEERELKVPWCGYKY